jgi:hypothetical protein
VSDGRRPGPADDGRAAIEADYPGWRVDRSVLGRWYAAPRQPLISATGGREYRPSLGAEDPAALRAVLDGWAEPRPGRTG